MKKRGRIKRFLSALLAGVLLTAAGAPVSAAAQGQAAVASAGLTGAGGQGLDSLLSGWTELLFGLGGTGPLSVVDGQLYVTVQDVTRYAALDQGFALVNGQRYYVAEDGHTLARFTPGFVQVDGKVFHVEADGVTFTRVAAGFATVDGLLCYGSGDGYSLQTFAPGFVQLDGRTYRVAADGYTFEGRPAGYYMFGNDLYYVEREGAEFLTNGTVGCLTFGADGRYTSGNAELDENVRAALAACTNDSMTRSQKLRAAYLYVRDNGRYLSRDHHSRGSTAWAEENALFFLKNKRGNCYSFAGAFLYLARQLGYQASPVSGGVGYANKDHAWVMIPGSDGVNYIYDVELEYAYRYRYAKKQKLDLYKMTQATAPFLYHFPSAR